MDGAGGVPAWMTAQALVIKVKNLMMEEAIELLYKEIDEKRMAINGSFVRMSDKEGEMEQGIFLINNLVERRDELLTQFGNKIREMEATPERLNASDVTVLENAKKFVVAVQAISDLATYGRVFEGWFEDASMNVKEADPSAVLARTALGRDTHRAAALRFLQGSKLLSRKGLFTENEKGIINEAVRLLDASG